MKAKKSLKQRIREEMVVKNKDSKKELKELLELRERINSDIREVRNILKKKKFYKIKCFKCKWFILKSRVFGQFYCTARGQYPERTNPKFAIECDDFEKKLVKNA